MHEDYQSPSTMLGEPIVLEILVVSEMTRPRAPQATSRANLPASPKATVTTKVALSSVQGPGLVYKSFTFVIHLYKLTY